MIDAHNLAPGVQNEGPEESDVQIAERARGLEAAKIVTEMVTLGSGSVEDLLTKVAEKMVLPNADRIAGSTEVKRLLRIGQEALDIAIQNEKLAAAKSREMRVQSGWSPIPAERQMH